MDLHVVLKIDSMLSREHVAVKLKNFSLRFVIVEPDQTEFVQR